MGMCTKTDALGTSTVHHKSDVFPETPHVNVKTSEACLKTPEHGKQLKLETSSNPFLFLDHHPFLILISVICSYCCLDGIK